MSTDPTARRYGLQQRVDALTAAQPAAAGLTLERIVRRLADAVAEQTADGEHIDLRSFRVTVEDDSQPNTLAIRAHWLVSDPPRPRA